MTDLAFKWDDLEVSGRRARKKVYEHALYVGSIDVPVAIIFQKPKTWDVQFTLPAIADTSRLPSVEEARRVAEFQIKRWFEQAFLAPEPA